MSEEKKSSSAAILIPIVVALVTAFLVAAPSAYMGHEVTMNLLEERVSAVRETAASNAERIRVLEAMVSEVQVTQKELAKNVKIAANEAKSNGNKIDDLSKDLNRLIGAWQAKKR